MPRQRRGRFASLHHAHTVATQWAHVTGVRHRVTYNAERRLWAVAPVDAPGFVL